MPERVRITDVSPRDGLQNEPGIIPTAEKVRLVELLCATGVDEIEVTSFVSPKWVPQLGDGAEVLKELALMERAGGIPPLPEGGGRGKGGWAPVPARNPITVGQAKALRRAMTGPERALWECLSGKRLGGYKFRRQHPFGPFILDFYCPAAKLAVELDGLTHANPQARVHDEERTLYLREHGLRVIRFSDDAVLQNIESVLGAIQAALQAVDRTSPFPLPLPSGKGRWRPLFSALVPNERGFQGVLDVNRGAGWKLIGKVAVFAAASDTFSMKNTNATIAQTLERFVPVVAAARSHGVPVRGYVSCVIACPFEGPIAAEPVVDVCRQLVQLGVEEIDLGDTIGAGSAETVRGLLTAYARALPLSGGLPVTIHLHDTFGRAAECVRVALDMGIRSFDGSVAGLGGCPYASTPGKRAPGNISTELLVKTIHDAGYETGVDLDRLAEAAAYAREIVARSRAGAPR